MRAAYYDRNGAASDVLTMGEVDTPRPGPGEVLVRVKTSGVNPSDVKSRAGVTRKMSYPRIIPHSDGAGIIEQAGEGGPKSRVGERVWIWNGQWKRPFGTAAEMIVVPEQQAVPLPDKVGFDIGACLGIPAMTAFHAVALAGANKGTTLLVPGGAGAVGNYAIQFAKMSGATVISTVSSAAKAQIAREAGADHVIDYKGEDVGARVAELTGKMGVDAILEVDLAANAGLIPAVLRPKGGVVVYGTSKAEAQLPAFFCLTNSIALQFMLVYELDADARRAAIEGITRLLEEGRLRHRVAKVLPIDDIVAAHEAVEQGITGNVVVELG